MSRWEHWKRRLPWLVGGVLALLSGLCFLLLAVWSGKLTAQQEAKRWQGESELSYAQVSCFLPVDEPVSRQQIYEFRQLVGTRLHEAAVDVAHEETLLLDAWSTGGKVTASTDLGHGEARITAVGGSFFEFHPIRLLNGSYLRETDLTKDRVLLDEELAWLLFGGTQLQGLELKLNGVPFVVGGVVRREQDLFSLRAYDDGMGLFMSYDAYANLVENTGLTCYEYVTAEPVGGFAVNIAREKFPIGRGEIVQNTNRFSLLRLVDVLRAFPRRSMQTRGIVYPYWENAARSAEDQCAAAMLLGFLLALYPFVALLMQLLKVLRRGKNQLADETLPALKDRAEEAVRVRQRRAWERRHGKHEKR